MELDVMELIRLSLSKGADIFANVSGGKDGQAMVKMLSQWKMKMKGLVHADLGRVEWKQSPVMCRRLAEEFNLPLEVVKRHDGLDMVDYWKRRMHIKLDTTRYLACDIVTRQEFLTDPEPFWSSSKLRYCTSDMKREPINHFYRNCGSNFIISCEGIRAAESTARSKKEPLTIRDSITSKFYNGMTVAEAIAAYRPDKRLVLTWYPIFNFSLEDVWETYGMTTGDVDTAKMIYNTTGHVPSWWPFHDAYAFGNERVSCMFCIMGCAGDLQNAAKHNPELLREMQAMEVEGMATFRDKKSLQDLIDNKPTVRKPKKAKAKKALVA